MNNSKIITTLSTYIHSLREGSLRQNCLAGLTVALALIPEAIAFALIAGVAPLVGLYAAFIVGLITGLFGGKPGMISGATGALAVVMVALVAQHGTEFLFATVILMGCIQVAAGYFKLGRFVRMVPYPVMLGFVNGLAIVIMLAQFQQFRVESAGTMLWLTGHDLWVMCALVLATMGLMVSLPKITQKIPSALGAIIAVTAIVNLLALDVKTVGDMASIAGTLPTFHMPNIPYTFESLRIIFPYALVLSMIGLVESLLTLKLLEEKTEIPGSTQQECYAQGFANIIAGCFATMGGCAMIGQSMINMNSGAKGRVAAISAALFLILFILIGAPIISMIPIAALVGVMFMVVIGTFEWDSFRLLRKLTIEDSIVMLAVTALTVKYDLAVAVFVGIVISCLVFTWKRSHHVTLSRKLCELSDVVTYKVHGCLFFSSVPQFNAIFDYNHDPEVVYLDLADTVLYDSTAIDAVHKMIALYAHQNKVLKLINVKAHCQKLFQKAI